MDQQHRELEMRLGVFVLGRFTPGVSKEVFDQLEIDFRDATSLTEDQQWVEIVDYYYTFQGGQTRTRVEYDSNSMELHTSHVTKTSIKSIVLTKSESGEGEACRIEHSSEIPVATTPTVCMPTHVRIKQRKTFNDVRDGGVVWVYELSKTWSGNNRSIVEHLQHISEPIYEVECELVDNKCTYINQHTNAYISDTLCTKAKLLMGQDPQLSDVGNAVVFTTDNISKRGRISSSNSSQRLSPCPSLK